ncbi:MAG: nuclear transport factor 2 family protein [Acidobacteriia bacterium]|jgi:ketosteroid isomerase-like protein|nr:nuclear transport factor 2 family protein [Terriglobia bacterium]
MNAERRKPLTEEEVVSNMKAWQEAYESGSPKFFDFFDHSVSLFTLSSPTRVDGRDVYRRGFEQFFLNTKRNSQILSPEVRLLGEDAAMMTFHNRILSGNVATNIRGSVVFIRDNAGALKCVHMHNSPLGQPTALPTFADAASAMNISVLEERVASASAMTGTPK